MPCSDRIKRTCHVNIKNVTTRKIGSDLASPPPPWTTLHLTPFTLSYIHDETEYSMYTRTLAGAFLGVVFFLVSAILFVFAIEF